MVPAGSARPDATVRRRKTTERNKQMDNDSRRAMIVGAALAVQAEHETDVAVHLDVDPAFQMTYVVEGERCWLPVIACANGGYAEFPTPLRYTVALFFG